jgi:hypothetical protein
LLSDLNIPISSIHPSCQKFTKEKEGSGVSILYLEHCSRVMFSHGNIKERKKERQKKNTIFPFKVHYYNRATKKTNPRGGKSLIK